MNQEIKLITQYIRENRQIYTRGAIDQQLTDAGYKAEDIAAAWGSAEAIEHIKVPEQVSPDPQSARQLLHRLDFWGAMLGYIVLFYTVPLLLNALLPGSVTSQVLPYVILGLLVGAIVVGSTLRYREINYSVGQGLLAGVAMAVIVIPACLIAALYGFCVATGVISI